VESGVGQILRSTEQVSEYPRTNKKMQNNAKAKRLIFFIPQISFISSSLLDQV